MNKDVVDAVLNIVNKSEFVDSLKYKGKVIDFSLYSEILDENLGFNENSVIFVDGGNCEILSAPNFSLHLIRLYAVLFKDNEKVKSFKKEYYCLSSISSKDGIDGFSVQFFPEREGYFFNFDEPLLNKGNERATPSEVCGICRRILEIDFLNELSLNAKVLVLDGTLSTKFELEKKAMDKLLALGPDKFVIGISKTNNEVTDDGSALGQVLLKNEKFDSWSFKVNEGLYFLKLNKHSKYVFKVECASSLCEQAFFLLKKNSNDFIFPGYPYGLILVDKFARVSNKEKEYLITMFKTKSNSDWGKILAGVNSLNAHDILDNIS